jgi:MFS family permease
VSLTPHNEPTQVIRDNTTTPPADETTLGDVKQLGLWAAIMSLGGVFWIVGGMEMVERLAYYGVRAVATLYATRPLSEQGLGVTMTTFGTLLLFWTLTQSLIPVFTGGFSDRYGYKLTIGVATAIKVLGYLLMAWLPTYWGFFTGAMFLAAGTAVFKPGIQGTLIRSTNRRNSSMAWGIFYQTVNIGGWIGPLIALYNRSHLGWPAVFYTNAAIICLNFVLLLTYREPGKAERLARRQRIRDGLEPQRPLVAEALAELKKPHLFLYLLIFVFWWMMFPMLWDVLPKYVEDWVNTAPMVQQLFGPEGTSNPVWKFLLGMDAHGQNIQPEGIVNINACMIMFTCFLFANFGSKLRATTSMCLGTVLIVIALALFGASHSVGLAVLAMVIFSAGEMLASPKFCEYIGNIAPLDKKAMWIGFAHAPILLGWTIEGKLGPALYDVFSSKDTFARQLLVESGLAPAQVTEQALPIGEAFKKLVAVTGENPEQLTQLLYATHHVGMTWYIFAAVGVASAVMIWLYGRWVQKLARRSPSS